MKRSKISKAIDRIDDRLVADAVGTKVTNKITVSWARFGALAAAFLVILCGAVYFVQNMNPSSNNNTAAPTIGGVIVALDVNPGFELEVSEAGKVEEVKTVNEDAKTVLGDMNLKGVDLDVALNALIGSMFGHGYLSVDKNSILVSVDAENSKKAADMQERIKASIYELLANSGIEVSLITQEFKRGDNSDKEISAAKAALIRKIVDSGLHRADGSAYTYEQLKKLNVNELKLMLESKNLTVEGAESTGSASKNGLLEVETVKAAVAEKSGVPADKMLELEIELDYEDRLDRLVYEVEFEYEAFEYEYEIDAKSGEILNEEIEEK